MIYLQNKIAERKISKTLKKHRPDVSAAVAVDFDVVLIELVDFSQPIFSKRMTAKDFDQFYLNMNWHEALSPEYQDLRRDVEDLVRAVYECEHVVVEATGGVVRRNLA